MPERTGVVANTIFFDHCIDLPVKETPERLQYIYRKLNSEAFRDRFQFYTPRSLTDVEMNRFFTPLYLDQLRHHTVQDNPFSYDKDTYLMDCTIPTAKLAAGSCIDLASGIMNKDIDRGFAIIRPPGHHADQGSGMGFCVFNNIAVTASHLLENFGLERILIFDFDAHHGNGTQNWFYHDNRVLTLSIHQENLFPANTGAASEFGTGEGFGYNVNIPTKSGFGDLEYNCLLGKVVQEMVDQFMPQFILVAAGFDGHEKETISSLNLSTSWFKKVTEIIKHFSLKSCEGRFMYVLEGGYNSVINNDCILVTLDAMEKPVSKRISFSHSPRAIALLNSTLLPVLREKWAFE